MMDINTNERKMMPLVLRNNINNEILTQTVQGNLKTRVNI